jgi:hypothetical protein
MGSTRVLSAGAAACLFLTVVAAAVPPPGHAAWVNSTGTQFQVGGQLFQITPTSAGTTFADPSCGSQGGTSLALVQGLKLAQVDPVRYPLVLVVSCLDNGGSTTIRARLNFINPADGKVIKQISTTAVPSNGWAHFVNRPDKGDLLGCGANGALYSIDYSQQNSILDGTATQLTSLPSVATSCTGLTWDAEADMIYLGLSVGGGDKIGRVVRFKEGTSTLLGDFTNLPCPANGLTISGGVLLMSCDGALSILRLDKNTGVILGAHGTVTATGLTPLNQEPGLGDLACDPVTFHKDGNGKDRYTDAMWSRRGANGNGVAALEFPAFTCGLPSNSVILQNGVPFSPLAAGLGVPAASIPGAIPRAACFDVSGRVIDEDGDGIPDCWETAALWPDLQQGIDFDGDGVRDLDLCAPVDRNGDGVAEATECADPQHKDLFVYIDYMQNHKPDPKALSQTQSPATLVNNVPVGVKSVREAFGAAPVENPDATTGIRIHFQVAETPVTFTPLSGPPTSHVNQVALTPCTGPATAAVDPAQSVDFDTVKAANFGTVAERANLKALNGKRLAFRYVLFAHNLVGNPSGGSNGSGCAEVGGDDAVVSLGSFTATTVDSISHSRGTTDQQAGTLMHEFGHLLGLRHGGLDADNCKPNYRSVMSYSRQFAGSPIPNRRLDYSRSLDPLILLPDQTADLTKTGVLNEGSLNEVDGLGVDPSLGPILPFFPSGDQIVYGPNAWSLVAANAVGINWNRNTQGKLPKIDTTPVSANINAGATAGCDGSGTLLEGQDDWNSLLYRASAAIDFAGGARTEAPKEMTKEDETAFYQARDTDGNGIGDGTDCGAFSCTHRIDIKPSFPFPKTINPGTEANITIAIFSEKVGTQVWNAPVQVMLNDQVHFPLTFKVESFVALVKVNNKGQGTCSTTDVADPINGQKDGIKDLKCQFPTSGLPSGTHSGEVSGFFFASPSCLDPALCEVRAFSGRQEVTILP